MPWDTCLFSLSPFLVLFISPESILMHVHLHPLTHPYSLFKVTNQFHFVRCTGEVLILNSYDSAAGSTSWFLPPPHLLSWSGHLLLSYFTPSPTTSWSKSLFPSGGSVPAPFLSFFFFPFSIYSHFCGELIQPQAEVFYTKFISSLDPAPELQTHISNCLLLTPLGCLRRTS